jgi:hypothetical protein
MPALRSTSVFGWTLWRAAEEVIPELNRLLRGWGGYYHDANSTRVFDRMNRDAGNRVQRWLWRNSTQQRAQPLLNH